MIIYRIKSDGGNVIFPLMSLRIPIHEVMLTRCCDFSHHFPNHMTACDNILAGKTPARRPPLAAIISLPYAALQVYNEADARKVFKN